jgi:branched-chain amino acid transport system permease protein
VHRVSGARGGARAGGAVAARRTGLVRPRLAAGRHIGGSVAVAVAAAAVLWVLYKAFGEGFGRAGNVPQFLVVGLNGLSLAGLYFIVASGFTLIFGLMRVVNMAHGSLYLLGGYIGLSLTDDGVPWLVAVVLAGLFVGAVGLVMQQLFLRWNQGQELRQALITIGLSIILADQMIAHFDPTPRTLAPPSGLTGSVGLGLYGLDYPAFRLFLIGAALLVALLLWLLIKRTRFGIVIRAGVDNGAMASALGVNVQLVFAAAFFLGSALAGLAGVFGGTVLSVAPGQDSKFLLSSLIVVIIGGMGSLAGAALGALALGLVEQLSSVYLPEGYTNYSILLTFILLIVVLAVRPTGIFGRPG